MLTHREADAALGLTRTAAGSIGDPRAGRNARGHLAGLLRRSILSRLANDEDADAADRLGRDPLMRRFVGGRAAKRGAASTDGTECRVRFRRAARPRPVPSIA